MKMISKIMRSMRDTGLLEGMSDEDCDTLVTAALEALRKPNDAMLDAGETHVSIGRIVKVKYERMIVAKPPRRIYKDA